jgi:hypothetical protein
MWCEVQGGPDAVKAGVVVTAGQEVLAEMTGGPIGGWMIGWLVTLATQLVVAGSSIATEKHSPRHGTSVVVEL